MKTKTVYTTNKHSYGKPFCDVCNTLDELKRAIVKQETFFSRPYYDREWTDDMYTEELFKKYKKEGDYHLRKICLHEDEEIEFSVNDGKSWFKIVKKEPNILSYIMIFNPEE
jgi:hypothetical protein